MKQGVTKIIKMTDRRDRYAGVCSYGVDPQAASQGYIKYDLVTAVPVTGSAHCGGSSVTRLADGTPYIWVGGTVDDCQAKCRADAMCNAFVRNRRTGACSWKFGVSADTVNRNYNSGDGLVCYIDTRSPGP